MSHTHYVTDALVLGGTPVGEANRYLSLLTREFGLVAALARGVRFERSKLRFALADGRACTLTLLRGREVWRITGAMPAAWAPALSRKEAALRARLFALLRRLLPGEERNDELFAIIEDALSFLAREHPQGASLAALEELSVLRALGALGYRSRAPALAPLLGAEPVGSVTLARAAALHRPLVSEINSLLSASHL